MKKLIYITVALLLGASQILAEKNSSEEIDNNYTKVIVLDKGIKRTVLIPKDNTQKNKMSSMKAEQAESKDGVIVKFKQLSSDTISAFEMKYNLKLKHKLAIGYCIFLNLSEFTDIQIVKEIIKNESNIETVKVNWKMNNTVR